VGGAEDVKFLEERGFGRSIKERGHDRVARQRGECGFVEVECLLHCREVIGYVSSKIRGIV